MKQLLPNTHPTVSTSSKHRAAASSPPDDQHQIQCSLSFWSTPTSGSRCVPLCSRSKAATGEAHYLVSDRQESAINKQAAAKAGGFHRAPLGTKPTNQTVLWFNTPIMHWGTATRHLLLLLCLIQRTGSICCIQRTQLSGVWRCVLVSELCFNNDRTAAYRPVITHTHTHAHTHAHTRTGNQPLGPQHSAIWGRAAAVTALFVREAAAGKNLFVFSVVLRLERDVDVCVYWFLQ